MKLSKMVYIAFTVFLLNISGCALMNSSPEDIASNAADVAKEATGTVVVNASETSGQENSQASCETKYNEKSTGRAHNIKLGAEKLNGVEITPGTVFSFNETLGPVGKASGYKKARIFVRGKDAEGYGGGVCQISSALYNCALDLGLKIVERHPHSKPVGYVPENKDAATSYGGKDLKFENTLGKTLKITTTAESGVLTVKMSG